MKSALPFLSLLLLSACGGLNQQGAASASDVSCPPGQTYDGQFCQVDQNVATAEIPAPSMPEESEVSPEQKPGEPAAVEEPQLEATPEEAVVETEPVSPISPATPVDYAMAAQAAPVMHYLASSHLPAGARPLGAPFAGQFTAGQVLEQKVQLTAGKCYTVVGMGLPPIAELDLFFFEEDSSPEQDSSLKQGGAEPIIRDDTVGAQAVLGSRNACFKPSKSGAVTLRIQVVQGQGVAAAQVFQK